MHFTASHRRNHRRSVGLFIDRLHDRLMETGNNDVDFFEHRAGTVDIAMNVFNV
ncbi:hypothetical protein D3C80_2072310 [compost metagenome]